MTDQIDVDELVAAAHKLVTVSLLAADVLSEEFDTLVRPSAEAVQAILERFPTPIDWDGSIRDEDIEEKALERRGVGEGKITLVGVELRHKVTGIARQSTSRPTREGNRAVARRALEKAVAERWQSMQK